jgi:hypothetical protein
MSSYWTCHCKLERFSFPFQDCMIIFPDEAYETCPPYPPRFDSNAKEILLYMVVIETLYDK